ncbi:MAG: cadherin repeat domain-containing protein, partial [Myxococcales bacterium]|nr:cadherin repeat domain-containing protein [Myxococcales bacterium]
VAIHGVPEAPSFGVRTGRTSVPEYAPFDTTVAQLAASDPDEGDTITYGWVSEDHVGSGSDRRAFEVDAQTGRVYVVDAASLDFETGPVVELTVDVVDTAGLRDVRTVVVDLIDRQTQTQVLTIPLLSEAELLVSPSTPFDLLVASGGTQRRVAVATEPAPQGDMVLAEEGFEQDFGPPDGPPEELTFGPPGLGDLIPIGMRVSGRVDAEVDVDVSAPVADIYLPVELSLRFPDDLVLGEPFTPLTDWTLQDDAILSGTSLGIDVRYGLGFSDFRVDLVHDTLGVAHIGPIQKHGAMSRRVEPSPLVGRKLSVLYPNGVSIAGASPPVHLCFRVAPELCPDLPGGPTCETVADPACDRPEGTQPDVAGGQCGDEVCYADLEG